MLENTRQDLHAGHNDRASIGGTSRDACSAEDLKTLLHRIADHFADADRRHQAALCDMQDRLTHLGKGAQCVALKAPQPCAVAIGRIEEGREAHAEHGDEVSKVTVPSLAELEAAAPSSTAGRPLAVGSAPETILSASREPSASVRVTEVPAPAPPSSTPSYQDTGDWAMPEATPEGLLAAEHSIPHDADESWDHESVAALAHVPDAGEAALLAAETSASLDEARAAFAEVPAEFRESDEERAWLDARLAEVAARVEESLVSMLSESSVLALGERFHQFEQRFGAALEDVATRADVAGLTHVEAHILELAQHVHEAHQRLSRLGVVERQLSQLMERVSEERIARLEGPSTLSDISINGVAAAVAEGWHEPFANLAMDGNSDRETLEELRHLIQELISTQRRGDDETASALDTVQQAMIGILDRLDLLEETYRTHRSAAVDAAPSVSPAEQLRFDGEVRSPARREQERADERPGSWALAEDAADPVEAVSVVGPSGPTQHAAAVADAGRDAEPVTQQEPADRVQTVLAGESALHAEDASPATSPVKPSREEFIAAARRAARQAANEPAENMPLGGQAAAGKGSWASVSAGPWSTMTTRSRLKVAAVLGLLIVGIGFTSCSVLRAGADKASKVDPKLRAAETDAAGRLGAAGTGVVQSGESEVGQATIPDGANQGAASESEADQAPAPQDRATRRFHELPAVRDASAGGAIPSPQVGQYSQPLNPSAQSIAADGDADGVVGSVGPLALGITVQTASTPSAQEILRSQQRQSMAALSERVGAAQSAVQAFPVALAPGPSAQTEADTTSTPPLDQSAAGLSALDMPPAMVGPMSLRLAAAKGDPSAEFEVASRFAEGKGVQQDLEQAVAWYQRAAARGLAQAQYRLATFYERGLGVKTDLARAKVWYKRAAEHGNIKAMHNLAVLSSGRESSAADYLVAAHWFAQAAERGLGDSQFNLAILYENGFGVGRDLKQAYKWVALVAQAGDKQAVRRRDEMRGKLQATELREAEDLIASWRSKPVDALANDPRAAGEAWKARQFGGPSG